MGLDPHCLNLLRLGKTVGVDYSEVVTIGRQGLFLSDDELMRFLREAHLPCLPDDVARIKADGFSEEFLKHAFGSRRVDSIDASPHENATVIHDMNAPLHHGRDFSVVLDFGCLEHVFNFPVAISNAIACCRPGGHLLHALPSNNWCGHGFYQFSPEIFFSLYSDARGFQDTQVFLAETDRPGKWYRLRNPLRSGKRVDLINRQRTYVLVLTRKTSRAVSPLAETPQQSDYAYRWNQPSPAATKAPDDRELPARLHKLSRSTGLSSVARLIRLPLRAFRTRVFGHRLGLHGQRRDMEELDIDSLIGRFV